MISSQLKNQTGTSAVCDRDKQLHMFTVVQAPATLTFVAVN